MFTLASDSDEPSNYHSYSPPLGSDYGSNSRSGSQSPSDLVEGSVSSQAGVTNTVGPNASSPGTSSKNPRKRRALPPINLANAPPIDPDELSNDLPGTSGSAPVSSDEESPAGSLSHPESTSNNPLDKRIRLVSSSSTSSLASLLSHVGSSEGGSQLSLVSSDAYYDLSDPECGHGTPSAKLLPPARSGTLIGNGEFELVSSGQECKAVHISTQIIHHCMAMKQEDYNTFLAVYERIELSKHRLTADELRELRRLLMPEETRVVKAEDTNLWYVITPDHQGSLHTFYNAEAPAAAAKAQSPWTEQQRKTIFRQVVRLVAYCHQIGIYFGDFRLQKLVYTDRKSSQIRVLHLRNIYVAPLIDDDTIRKPNSKCCPAYIAPEMMRFVDKKPFAAAPADIWSLGVLLFVLSTGRFPFYATRPSSLARMIRLGQWSFRSTDKLSRSARLLIQGLIRLNPAERPSAKEILVSDWLQSTNNEPACPCAGAGSQTRPSVPVQVTVVVPENGRINEANPRIPPQLLRILVQPSESRNNIYASRSDLRASMESFASALHRSLMSATEDLDQVVPERPQQVAGGYEKDALGISVIRVAARRNATAVRS